MLLDYRMLSDWGKKPSRLLFLTNRYNGREFAASLRFLRRERAALISGVLEGLSSRLLLVNSLEDIGCL